MFACRLQSEFNFRKGNIYVKRGLQVWGGEKMYTICHLYPQTRCPSSLPCGSICSSRLIQRALQLDFRNCLCLWRSLLWNPMTLFIISSWNLVSYWLELPLLILSVCALLPPQLKCKLLESKIICQAISSITVLRTKIELSKFRLSK